MITDLPSAPLAPGLKGAGGGAVEKSLSASHTEILTLPLRKLPESGLFHLHLSAVSVLGGIVYATGSWFKDEAFGD